MRPRNVTASIRPRSHLLCLPPGTAREPLGLPWGPHSTANPSPCWLLLHRSQKHSYPWRGLPGSWRNFPLILSFPPCPCPHPCACLLFDIHKTTSKIQSHRWFWAGNRTRVLSKSSVCSWPLNHLFGPTFLFFRVLSAQKHLVKLPWGGLWRECRV